VSRRVAVSGASGLVGTALCRALEARGDTVLRLVRGPARSAAEVFWDWKDERIEFAKLEGIDALVHLAGRSIATRWNAQTIRAIADSRTQGTALLAQQIAELKRPPSVLLSASAIGYYGNGRERQLDDASPHGEGWLADVCLSWEAATQPAMQAGIRVATPRIGIVLSPGGGALKKMLPAFRFGLGGRIGDGKQGFSWVGLHDLVRILLFALDTPAVQGAFNATAPHPVSNDEFTRTLARVLGRLPFLPMPDFVVGAIWGEMGQRLMLDGDFIRPTRLAEMGFDFEAPTLEAALRKELG
jgi:uncharacterized protein (TIGR01777 family)